MGHWRPFTAEEDAIIIQLRVVGATYREIASRLGRTEDVVAFHARKTGLVEFTPMSYWRPFTPEEDAIIIRCRLIGVTYREIGIRLGRDMGVVAIHARKTRIVDFTPMAEQTKRKNKRLVTILKMWNAGATGSQIGAVVGLLRGEVHREIAGARKAGLYARRIDKKEFLRRAVVGQSLYERNV